MRKAATPILLALAASAFAAGAGASATLPSGEAALADDPTSAPAPQPPSQTQLGHGERPATESVPGVDAYRTERSLGAFCPGDVSGRTRWDGPVVKNGCYGRMPPWFAELLRGLPASFPVPADLGSYAEQLHVLKAIPGFGQRPDLMIDMFGSWIRSFEGTEPGATVYLVHFLYDRDELARYYESHRSEFANGVISYGTMRAFRTTGAGLVEDVTEQILPPRPSLTPAEAGHYGPHIASSNAEAKNSDIQLDTDRLQFAPTMRWLMEFDPETPIPTSDPRRYADWGFAHFGFIVWNGERFELRDRVSRALWPCKPVADGKPACSYYPDAGPDSFVIQ